MTFNELSQMFEPTHPILEIILRGSIIYLGLFILLRVVLDRRSQGISTADVLLLVLIADAVQNGMSNEYRSVTEGLVLAGTILFWNFLLDWLAFHFPALQRAIRQPPLPLIENGQLIRRNMRQELITLEELRAMLREQGIDDVGSVGHAFLEDNGKLTVISSGKAATPRS